MVNVLKQLSNWCFEYTCTLLIISESSSEQSELMLLMLSSYPIPPSGRQMSFINFMLSTV